MRVLVAPRWPWPKVPGPASRSRVLASAMVSRGWQVTLCIPGRLLRRDPRWRERHNSSLGPPDAPLACRVSSGSGCSRWPRGSG